VSPAGATRSARAVALEALLRVEEGAYANLVLAGLLDSSGLSERDRAFTTDLVYGTTRMRRACDFLLDRFLVRPPDMPARAALRLGAYQIAFLGTPPHAAVGETVGVAPRRVRSLVNAVLRRLAGDLAEEGLARVVWPNAATRLSYPDWVVDRLVTDLGQDDAFAALEAMNQPAARVERPDGYVQDLASQWVGHCVEAEPGHLVADLCAAPGGKATAIAEAGARVVAGDLNPARVQLVRENARRLGLVRDVHPVVADGRRPPLRAGCYDRVLVDAPCTGLGVLRRRPDARWRVEPDDPARLAALQLELVDAAAALVRPGGSLVYSVCTLTRAETIEVAERFAADHPGFAPIDPPGPPWRRWGSGAIVLPHDAGTDGMALFRWRAT